MRIPTAGNRDKIFQYDTSFKVYFTGEEFIKKKNSSKIEWSKLWFASAGDKYSFYVPHYIYSKMDYHIPFKHGELYIIYVRYWDKKYAKLDKDQLPGYWNYLKYK